MNDMDTDGPSVMDIEVKDEKAVCLRIEMISGRSIDFHNFDEIQSFR